jgi:hypothetical protein
MNLYNLREISDHPASETATGNYTYLAHGNYTYLAHADSTKQNVYLCGRQADLLLQFVGETLIEAKRMDIKRHRESILNKTLMYVLGISTYPSNNGFAN